MPWGWICAQIIGDRRSTKVAKKIVVPWHLTFLRQGQVCFPMHLYEPHKICMGKLLRISDDFSSEATEPNLLKFLAHLSRKCSWWAIVVSQCPSWVICCPSIPPTLMGQFTRYLVGSIGVTCTSKIAKIVPIENPRWPPSWKSIFCFFSWTQRPVDSKYARKHQGDL